MNKYLEYSEEVAAAKKSGKPVVALESTIISHGMPYPRNAETARQVESIIRENGAVPATIAILGGKLKAGLSSAEIDYLAKTGTAITKVSRRDIPVIIAKKADGATTVAATMIIAKLADIQVFCTGGIGGVHRGGEHTFDISADLEELAKTSVLVVCAGAKSILDLGLTLEYLETRGVPILGYTSSELPAFFTRTSGHKLAQSVENAGEAASVFFAMQNLGYTGGAVVANPIPKEYSLPESFINAKIDEALAAAKKDGVFGKELTPYLLAKIDKVTGGKSLDANIELVYNNARVASLIAVELTKLNAGANNG